MRQPQSKYRQEKPTRPVIVLVDAHVVRRPDHDGHQLTILVGMVLDTCTHLAGVVRLHGDRVAALEGGQLVKLATDEPLGSGNAHDLSWYHELAIEALLRQVEIDSQVERYLADPDWQLEIANWSGLEPP